MQLPDPYPPLLAELACLFYARLSQHLPAETAQRLALAQANDISQTYEGCQIYIPKQDGLARARRDAAIARAFNGYNVGELAHRYRLSATQIYDILARQRQARQPSLFDSNS